MQGKKGIWFQNRITHLDSQSRLSYPIFLIICRLLIRRFRCQKHTALIIEGVVDAVRLRKLTYTMVERNTFHQQRKKVLMKVSEVLGYDKQELIDRLASLYKTDCVAVGLVCDMALDRSGALLGYVRERHIALRSQLKAKSPSHTCNTCSAICSFKDKSSNMYCASWKR
jgi:hypothetical protein